MVIMKFSKANNLSDNKLNFQKAMQIANFAGGPGRRKRLSGGKLASLN